MLRQPTPADWEALREFAKLIGRNARERHEKRIAMRRAWLDDAQADRDWHEDEREWCK